MLNGQIPAVGLEEGVLSSVTCLALDKAMNESKVIDMKEIWKQVDF